MTRIAFLFPGQGSQCPEMGLDFIQESPSAREKYAAAEAALGWAVDALSQPEGAEKLGITCFTQPALYTVGCVIADWLREAGMKPALVAGHSAGEYAALYAAGAWDFETGLRVIAERGRLMHEKAAPGSMAAVMGLDPQTLTALCQEWSEGIVCVANYNSPKQIVISGEEKAINGILPLLKEKGARRAMKLNVSGAFHSPLMSEAQALFESFMKDIPIQAPNVPWISNNTAAAETDPCQIRDLLVRQFCEPVRWIESMQRIADQSDKALEVGPGAVLKGLAKACCEDFPCETTATVVGTRKVMEENGL